MRHKSVCFLNGVYHLLQLCNCKKKLLELIISENVNI